MAIGTTPLFSKISGSAGPVDFRTRRNGKIEIGKKRIPANPRSTEQQNTRNAYGRLHELWQNASWIDKEQYNNIATAFNISPWNAFLMRHLPIMRLNPVAYWPFVEGTGNTLHDFTVNKNHGTITGATWERSGKFNSPRLSFDAIDDYVNCGSNSNFNITDAVTIRTRYKLSSINTGYNAILKCGNGFVTLIGPRGIDGYSIWYAVGITNVGMGINPELENNKPRFNLTLTYDSNVAADNQNMYINSISKYVNTNAGTFNSNSDPLYIGSTSTYKPGGTMNELMIFDYALTQQQDLNISNSLTNFYED